MTVKISIFAFAAFATFSPLLAQEAKQDHKPGEATHDHGAHGDETTHFDKTSFGSTKEAWDALSRSVAEVEQSVTAKDFKVAQDAGERIGSAVHALEERSDEAAHANRAKLQSALKQLEKASDELRHGAKKENAASASLAIKKIKALMPVVQSLYASP